MADFLPAYEAMILAEGGYRLHSIEGDRGGMTYAGISSVMNPQWAGWAYIDRGETPPTQMVRDFYRVGWWAPLRGDEIADQRIAQAIFSFAVNACEYGRPVLAAKLAQIVVGAAPDGEIGEKTLAAINAYHPELFLAQYTLAKIARRRDICMRDRGQVKFLLGWINRDLKEAA